MKILVFLFAATSVFAQSPSLSGTITDPSGAAVPGAVIELKGPGRDQRAKTDNFGQYSFATLSPGKYQIRIAAKGFSIAQKNDLRVDRPIEFNLQLVIRPEKEQVGVLGAGVGTGVSTDPASNGGAVVLGPKQLAALSDDPDELALQLQAMAGPAPGPGGGTMFIDGFGGGNLPPKSSIREVRINANPFSAEYDRPGFGRIEILTKPGSDTYHGQASMQYNGDFLNSRNPLLTATTQPSYQTQLYGMNLTGPLKRNKASFTLDFERRQIDENAFILATTLDTNLNPLAVNQALATPQARRSISPRIDYALNPKNTLTARYQDVSTDLENQGAGDFNLASRAYNEKQNERVVQLTETAVLSSRAINETRFQFLRAETRVIANNTTPGLFVQGAFFGGGPTVGNSHAATNAWELTNTSTFIRGTHTYKWGGRVRRSALDDTSLNNFAGTYVFYSLDLYRKALEQQPRAGAQLFSRNGGTPTTHVNQIDTGVFVNDDWRVRPNITLSFGVRYEVQSNIGARADLAPRIGFAWGLDARANRPAKTVLRAGFGTFYDRIANTATLNAHRYDGSTQQSFTILNPTTFPAIPGLDALRATGQPQALQPLYRDVMSPRIYQASIGVDRQINKYARLTVSYIHSRGVHLLNIRNINAPRAGAYPYGDRSLRLLTESAGFSRLHQLVVSPSVSYKKFTLFGNFTLASGKNDNEGLPADPYNLRAEWGPSSFGDVRHRFVIGPGIPLPGKISVMSFLVANSGPPYNITTGLDPQLTGYATARPALLDGVDVEGCKSTSLKYAAGFGCFNLNPTPGTPTIGRNYARGPAAVNLGMRVSRTWSFGERSETDVNRASGSGGHGGGGAPPGMQAPSSGKRYNFTLTASSLNALNHPNFAPPSGNLSSPYFGEYRSLGGLIVMNHGGSASTYLRKIDLQVRFTF